MNSSNTLFHGIIIYSFVHLTFDVMWVLRILMFQLKGISSSNASSEDESCESVGGEQECLSRRTLEAHLDYIYTNLSQPNPDPRN
jgi:hypothetical protein